MFKFTTIAVLVFSFFPFVFAHGTIETVTIASKSYTGPFPNGVKIDSPVRQITNLNPVLNPQGPDITCGWGSPGAASETISVPAGTEVKIKMRSGAPPTPWPHYFGPILAYMGECPDEDCNAADVKWFKVMEDGLRPDGTWAMKELFEGHTTNVTIPSKLKPGSYLLRHEILALHNAMMEGLAEFYVQCTQLKVTGGGTATPPASDLVLFPGAYSPTDPSIMINIFNNLKSYTPPGPPVWPNDASTGGGTVAAATATSSAKTKSTLSPSAASPTGTASSGGSKKCPPKHARLLKSRNMRRHYPVYMGSRH